MNTLVAKQAIELVKQFWPEESWEIAGYRKGEDWGANTTGDFVLESANHYATVTYSREGWNLTGHFTKT